MRRRQISGTTKYVRPMNASVVPATTAEWKWPGRRGEVDEQDGEDEGPAAHLLVDRHGTDGERGEQVPDGHHGRHVDLLRAVAEPPPDQPGHARVPGPA